MALTPGGGRSPSTRPRPSPPPAGRPRPPRNGARLVWPRSASVSVVRLGVLIGGLVIIVDLATTAMAQRSFNPDDVATVEYIDEIANYLLFFVLGILVVRDTGLLYAGVVAGVFSSILDAVVVSAASLMIQPRPSMEALESGVARDLAIGTVFAGLAGVVYGVVQRWSGGRRPR